MKRKISLRIKFTLLFLMLMLVLTGVLFVFTYVFQSYSEVDEYEHYAQSIGNVASSMVSAEEIIHYAETGEVDQAYNETQEELRKLQNQTDILYLYIIYPTSQDSGIYVYFVSDMPDASMNTVLQEYQLGDKVELYPDFSEAMLIMQDIVSENNVLDFGLDSDDGETYLASAYVPIPDDQGTAIAFVGVDIDAKEIMTKLFMQLKMMAGIIVIVMAVFFVIFMLITHISILRPISILKKSVERVAEGNYGEALTVRGHDEISEITNVFNRMSKNIQRHIEEIKIINHAYQKYVPSELFEILNKESVTQIEAGDQSSRFVTILSFQFSESKDQMWKKDGNKILHDTNQLFQNVIPLITKGKGFVERFQDTAMLVFYTEETDQALQSALSICQKVKEMEKRMGKASINVSMGMDYGTVLFGIIGGEKRMATVPLSAHTSMSKYLQQIAPLYGSKLLITTSATGQISDFHKTYHVRLTGMIKNRYSQVVEKIYDVYDSDSQEQREGKERTKEWYEKGVELFCMQRFQESRQAFIQVLKQFRNDLGAKRYMQYCTIYAQMEQEEKTEEIDIFMSDQETFERLKRKMIVE